MAPNCVVEFNGQHFVLGQRSLYIFDGQSMTDVAEGKVRDYLFSVLDQDRRYLCHVAHNIDDSEIWVHYPTAGSTGCEKCLVWSYINNTISFRDAPSSLCAFLTADLNNPAVRFDDDLTWRADDDTEIRFIDIGYSALATQLMNASDGFYKMDYGNQADGSVQTCFVQRSEIELGELDDWNMIRSIRPRAKGGAFDISIGRQDVQGGDITWEYSANYDPGEDYRLNCRVTGRLHTLKLSSEENVHWECGGIDIDYEIVGRR